MEYNLHTKFRLVPYIENGVYTDKETDLCKAALQTMYSECAGDRLEKNYSKDTLRLDRMEIFTFVFDDNNNPIQASGCQVMSNNVIRVFSRYYVYKQFRTDSKKLLDKTDNFMDLNYCLPKLTNYPLIIWSRDSSAGFFKRLKAGRPDIFSNWHVHNEKVEILWRNNVQHIFYTGNSSYINEIKKK